MTRHHYAIWHAYDNAISADDVLARFDTREERDEWCDRINSRDPMSHGKWEPVTLASVRHRFNPADFGRADSYWGRGGEFPERTCHGKSFHYIYQRPNYQL